MTTNSAEARTASLPLPQVGQPWSAPQSLPSAEDSFSSDFFLACLIWTALLALGAWAYFSAEWIGLL